MPVELLRDAEIPPARIETSAGTVEVQVRGSLLRAPGIQVAWLRPVDVVVTRPDGRSDRAEVLDSGGRVVRWMLVGGAVVAALALLAERKLKR